MKSHVFAILIVAACWAVAPVRFVNAQETINYASVSGRVVDPQGAVVRGAQVSARQTATNVTAQTVSDSEGRFRFPYLKIGPYELKVSTPGFADNVRTLTLDSRRRVRRPGRAGGRGVDATVTVVGEATVLEAARSQIAGTVPQAEVQSLPMNGRNFLDLALLIPGVSPTNTNSTQLFAETSAVPGQGISVSQPAQPVEQLHRRRPVGQRRRGGPERHPVRRGRGGAVPGGDVRRAGRARARAGRLRQRRHQERHQRHARHRVRLLSRRQPQRGQRAVGDDAADGPAAVRREPRRADRTQPDVLLHELRAAAARSDRTRHDPPAERRGSSTRG